MLNYHNYIFDLYGTLVDIKTNERKLTLWKRMALWYSMHGAAYHPLELKKSYSVFVAELEHRLAVPNAEVKLELVFQRLFTEKGVDSDMTLAIYTGQLFRTISMDYIQLYPNVEKTLNLLREQGCNLYLLTNAQKIFTEPEISMLGIIQCFDGILYSSEAGVKKPDQAFFQMLFNRYDLKKKESVMVGNDQNADAYGAVDFGIDSIYIHTNQSPELKGALPDTCIRLDTIYDVIKKDQEN